LVPASRAGARRDTAYCSATTATGNDIAVQRDRHGILADSLERTFGQANFSLGHLVSLRLERVGDIGVGDGTEQTAIDTCLVADRHREALELLGTALGAAQLLGSHAFQFGLLRSEGLDVGLRGTARAASGDQKVAGIAVFHFDDVTQIAQVDDFVDQNHLHGRLLSAGRCKA